MVTKEVIEKRFVRLKKIAEKYYQNNSYEKSLQCIKIATKYMYENNTVFVDYDLENLANSIAKKYKQNDFTKTDTLLFYQLYPMEVRGLAYIYINALINININFYWITYKSYKTYDQKKLISIASNAGNCTLIEIDDTNGSLELIKSWHAIISRYKPRWALMIPAPWDVESISAIGCYDNIEKILVNGTDHSFWFGATFFDKVLEFRDWGREISIKYRKIDNKKLIKFPYYPAPSNEKFLGFPFKVNEKTKIIVSGGSLYKIYGSDKFLKTVKYILQKYPECIFYYMGNGDTKPIIEFIKKNNLDNKFFLSEERKDFDEVIKRSYLYLNTYPLIGALMSQYAVANNVIPIGLNSQKDACNDVSALFLNDTVYNCNSIEELWKELDLLITSKDYYTRRKNELNDALLCEPKFSIYLKDILYGNFLGFPFNTVEVDVDELRLPYLRRQSYTRSTMDYIIKLIKIKCL